MKINYMTNIINKNLSFENLIKTLKNFWQNNGCLILEARDLEVGAATLNCDTALKILNDEPWNICQVQHCRRPTDGRFAENPNRLCCYYQMQIILKPVPNNIQELCLKSFDEIAIQRDKHDIRFIEDDWANPSIGASGLGYEVWCDGMEIAQFTYMQKIGGVDCNIIAGEITYGLERLSMYIQNKNSIFDIDWNDSGVKYKNINSIAKEKEICTYYQLYQDSEDIEFLKKSFNHYIKHAKLLLEQKMQNPGYEMCLKASNCLNVLDARCVISAIEKKQMILKIREIVKDCLIINTII